MPLAQARIEARQARGLKHPAVPRRYLDKYLLPELGRFPASDITPADVAQLLDDLKGRAPTAANDLLRFTRRIFAFGVRRRFLLSNPAADFSPRLDAGGTERPRSRTLSSDELAQLFEKIRATPSVGADNLLAVRLLLALCVRKGELLGARWEEFDLKALSPTGAVWRLPAARTKTGEGIEIPLVPEVVDWFQRVRELSAGSDFVFPKRRRDPRERVPHVGVDTLNVALQRVKHGLPHFALHDLRRTARTHLAALGIRREVAERCLGHKLRGVEGMTGMTISGSAGRRSVNRHSCCRTRNGEYARSLPSGEQPAGALIRNDLLLFSQPLGFSIQ